MMTRFVWLVSLLTLLVSSFAWAQESTSVSSTVTLDGETIRVRWSDKIRS